MNDTDLEVLSTPALIEKPVIIEVEKEQHNDLMNLFLAFPTACLSICLGLSILSISVFLTGTFLFVVDCSTAKIIFCKR